MASMKNAFSSSMMKMKNTFSSSGNAFSSSMMKAFSSSGEANSGEGKLKVKIENVTAAAKKSGTGDESKTLFNRLKGILAKTVFTVKDTNFNLKLQGSDTDQEDEKMAKLGYYLNPPKILIKEIGGCEGMSYRIPIGNISRLSLYVKGRKLTLETHGIQNVKALIKLPEPCDGIFKKNDFDVTVEKGRS